MNLNCTNCGYSFEVENGAPGEVYICKECGTSVKAFDPNETAEHTQQTAKSRDIFTEGQRFAGYVIEKRIGIGGMGVVYKARQISLDRPVALKILRKEFSRVRDYEKRFIREARSAGSLNHPNIIQIYDVGVEEDIYYFSMEYIVGESVDDTLYRKKRLSLNEGSTVILEVARALKIAAESGIIHRDIKPDNVMITKKGLVKVADFGLARILDDNEPSLTKTGMTLGTPYYMAPEQIESGKDVDTRADIYSLGATFFHLIVGKRPFEGGNTYEILRKHIDRELIFPENCELPEPVQAVIKKMMAKSPDDRFENMAAVIHAVERIRESIPLMEEGESRKRKRKVWMWISITLLFLLMLGILSKDTSVPNKDSAAEESSIHKLDGTLFVCISQPVEILKIIGNVVKTRLPVRIAKSISGDRLMYRPLAGSLNIPVRNLR